MRRNDREEVRKGTWKDSKALEAEGRSLSRSKEAEDIKESINTAFLTTSCAPSMKQLHTSPAAQVHPQCGKHPPPDSKSFPHQQHIFHAHSIPHSHTVSKNRTVYIYITFYLQTKSQPWVKRANTERK